MTETTILKKKTYIEMIKNSVGTRMFQHLYAVVDGEEKDIVDGGDLSCALFVSSILHQFDLINSPHATVSGLIRDLENYGWQKTDEPVAGAVIIWEPATQAGGEMHEHAGFSIGDGEAVSNSYSERVPVCHPINKTNGDGSMRQTTAIYMHPAFT